MDYPPPALFHFYKKILIPLFYDFSKISIPLNKGGQTIQFSICRSIIKGNTARVVAAHQNNILLLWHAILSYTP